MESENFTCSVCSMPYDATDHIPRVLINCGHTLCTSCLIEIIKNPTLRRCPLDSSFFKKSQKSLDHFPKNFALLTLLEGKNKNTCKIHGEELKMFCLKDKIKICSDCAFFGEHKEHATKWIKELKSQGAELKKDLEESLKKFEEREQDVEIVKNGFLDKIGEKFEEVQKILGNKEMEWKKQMESLFERNVEKANGLLLKDDIKSAIEEIDQARQKEENLAILDQDFGSIFARLQNHITQEEASKTSEESSKMMNCIESFLKNQAKSLEDCDLSKERVQPEFENLIETKQEPVFFQTLSLFTLGVSPEGFFIRVKNQNSIDPQNNLSTLNNKLKKVSIELGQYNSLFKNLAEPKFLSEILTQLNNYTSLTVSFAPEGLNDSRALHLLNILFERVQQLTEIDISFERCEITDEPILFFCNEFLSKAVSLKNLTIKLDSTLITDESLCVLARNMSSLKGLEDFRLNGSQTGITGEGLNSVFLAVPKDIRRLELNFEGINLPDEVIFLFEERVSPELELVEEVYLRSEGKDLEYKKNQGGCLLIKKGNEELLEQ